MSTHSVNIVTIDSVVPHPNADRLEIAHVDGWQCVTGKDQFSPGDKAVFIEPDYVVDTTWPEFQFLDKKGVGGPHRLKAVKLRGVLSYGLLLPVPPSLAGLEVGTDVMADLGVTRYVPPMRNNVSLGDMQELPADEYPRVPTPKFDLENIQRYPDIISIGEEVEITEKIDGTNARYMYLNGVMYIGSRNRWLKPDSKNVWTRMVSLEPDIVRTCQLNEGVILYGEIYGPIQALTYGFTVPHFALFAAYNTKRGMWVHVNTLDYDHTLERAPVLYVGPYDEDMAQSLAEGDSLVGISPGHMREGVVITPTIERMDFEIGRVSLKLISNRFWLDKNT